ncbi:helix-turn-helix transcriptional regulator [Zavarzinella formosa]|uniref:helix-turn-helix transcriptional regulator n=1 Tax=Zavarzinella formosa TaxID=360055 RepID=UPI000373BDF3|nr:helix-turn-helix domain-containing protein [Zavarzinella formosa]
MKTVPPPNSPRTYTLKDLARIFQVCDKTIKGWAKAGKIPGRIDFGQRFYRFNCEVVDQWIKDGRPKIDQATLVTPAGEGRAQTLPHLD